MPARQPLYQLNYIPILRITFIESKNCHDKTTSEKKNLTQIISPLAAWSFGAQCLVTKQAES